MTPIPEDRDMLATEAGSALIRAAFAALQAPKPVAWRSKWQGEWSAWIDMPVLANWKLPVQYSYLAPPSESAIRASERERVAKELEAAGWHHFAKYIRELGDE